MTVEREIAGFSLPFAAGVLISVLAGSSEIDNHMAIASVSLTVATALLASLIQPSIRHRSGLLPYVLITVLALCLGGFCGCTGSMLSWSRTDGRLIILAERCGARLGQSIDALPFSDPVTNAVIKALLTGERHGIPHEITSVFRESGASHILALSGFHLGIIYAIVKTLLGILGNKKDAATVRSCITMAICGFYTLATGAGPSIVRALLFVILHETAGLLHRHHSTASVLFAALIIQLTVSPTSITSVGFQLSYAAMAGIAFIYPRLKESWPGNPMDDGRMTKAVRWVWNSAAMSISCQITTAPLVWVHFHSFPQHFLLTNLLALPLTGLIIPVGICTIVLHAAGICSDLLTSLTEGLVNLLISSLDTIAQTSIVPQG